MKSVAFVAALVLAVGTAGVAQAQNLAVGPYAEFQAGFTAGSSVGGLFGGEVGISTNTFDLYFEGGRMLDTKNSQMDASAATIAAAIGSNATYEARQPTNYFDVGVWYKVPTTGKLQPYFGIGTIIHFHSVGPTLLLIPIAVLGSLSMIALGLTLAAGISSEELVGGLLNMLTWPMMLLSGIWFSLEGSPPWVRWAAHCYTFVIAREIWGRL